MIAIVHSIYSKSVHAPAAHAGLMDNESERIFSNFESQVAKLCNLPFFFANTFVCTVLTDLLMRFCCVTIRIS